MALMCPKCGGSIPTNRGLAGMRCTQCGLTHSRAESSVRAREPLGYGPAVPRESVVMPGSSGLAKHLVVAVIVLVVAALLLLGRPAGRNLAERFYNWITNESVPAPAPALDLEVKNARPLVDAHARTLAEEQRRSGATGHSARPVIREQQATAARPLAAVAAPVVPVPQPVNTDLTQAELARGAEVIVVSGYEGVGAGADGAPVQVTVQRPGCSVLLVLSSFKKVAWRVNAGRGTQIKAVVLSGYNDSQVAAPSGTPVYKSVLPFSSDKSSFSYEQLALTLKQLYGAEQVNAFHGQYALANSIVVDSLDNVGRARAQSAEETQSNLTEFHFHDAPQPQRQPEVGHQSAGHPAMAPTRVTRVQAASDQRVYQIVGHRFEVMHPGTGLRSELVMPSHFPELSWPVSVAYDSRRQVVALGSLGGGGFFYRFDTRTGQWLDYHSLDNFDIASLAYDEGNDRYVAMVGKSQMILSADGRLLSRPARAW